MTPLVCWLKPFMIPEILRIPVRTEVMSAKPIDYVNLITFVNTMENRRPQKKARNRNSKMATDDVELIDDHVDVA